MLQVPKARTSSPMFNWNEKLVSNKSSPLGVKLDDVRVLQLVKYVTSNRATALAEMRWAATVPLPPSIDSTEGTNTKTTPQVDLPRHWSYVAKYDLITQIPIKYINVTRNKNEGKKKRVYTHQPWYSTNRDHKGLAPLTFQSWRCRSK